MKTIFFGSSTFSLPFLQQLSQLSDLLLVVSTEDKPRNRGKKIISNYVKSYAQDMGLPVDAPANIHDQKWIESIRKLSPDLIVTASYGKIFPEELLKIPAFGCVNIHPSLLPQYRGAEPIFWQLYHGCKKSGLCIFRMNPKLDQGEILLSKSFEISEKDNYESLENQMIKIGLELQQQLLQKLSKNEPIASISQEHGKYFYARKITEKDEKIKWKRTKKDILNHIRALSPRIGAYTLFKGKRVKIFEAKGFSLNEQINPGSILIRQKKLLVKAMDGFIKIEQLQPEGKNIMPAQDFINGYLTRKEKYNFSE